MSSNMLYSCMIIEELFLKKKMRTLLIASQASKTIEQSLNNIRYFSNSSRYFGNEVNLFQINDFKQNLISKLIM